MKRWTDDHAARVAQEFAATDLAQAWGLFGAEVRNAVIDSLVMSELRVADSVDSPLQFTAGQICAFRDLLAKTLRDGVKRHNRAMRIAYTIDDGTRECRCDMRATDGQHVRTCASRGEAQP